MLLAMPWLLAVSFMLCVTYDNGCEKLYKWAQGPSSLTRGCVLALLVEYLAYLQCGVSGSQTYHLVHLVLCRQDRPSVRVAGLEEWVGQAGVVFVAHVQPGLRHYRYPVRLGETFHLSDHLVIVLRTRVTILNEPLLEVIGPYH